MAGPIHELNDSGELVELFKPQGLYLKPVARLHISIQLPQLKDASQSISNWDLMEKIKKMVRPHEFASVKVQKSTLEFVRFEAECDNRTIMTLIIEKLEGSTIKIIGFFDALKVRCAEAKQNFPTRHEWDAFFRDAKHMNEMKPGERPDTIFFANLPCKWFLDLRNRAAKEANERGEPSEFVLRRVFEQFGEVRCVDIPLCDPYRKQMTKSALQTFTHGADATFEAYVQYVEYIGFMKAMTALRGMKLVHIDDEAKVLACNIRVDFDRTKHLTDKSIRRRRIERERLAQLDREREERVKNEKELEERRNNEQKKREELAFLQQHQEDASGQRRREERRRLRRIELKRAKEEAEIERKIKLEERKLLVAQRRLESMRILTELFKRIQILKQKEAVERELHELEETQRRQAESKSFLEEDEKKRRERLLQRQEEQLRNKALSSYRQKEEKVEIVKKREENLAKNSEKRVKSIASAVVSVSVSAKSFAFSSKPSTSAAAAANGYGVEPVKRRRVL